MAWAVRHRSVSSPRSSNRTCRFPASGSPTGFTARHTADGHFRLVSRDDTMAQINLRLTVEFPRKPSDTFRCYQAHRQSPILGSFESAPEVRVLSSAGITRPHRSYDPVRRPPGPPPIAVLEVRPPTGTGLPRLPGSPFQRAVPITPVDRSGCICRLLPHSTRPSPTDRRVGIHNFTFEACSDFTRVTARWIAQPPKATFVTGLRDGQLPARPARQLPDQPTTLWMDPSSTGVPRLRGALPACG